MKRLILIYSVAICVALKGMIPAGASIIDVSGYVSGIWSADTVLVIDEICLPPWQSLTIQPGVKVLFWNHYKFIVDTNAVLTAVGMLGDSIFFDEAWAWPGNGWHGIRFLSASSNSQLEYCHLKNGLATGSGEDAYGGAIYCNNSSPTIQHCLIDSCEAETYGGGIYCTNSSPTISNNTISTNLAHFGGGGICCVNYSNPTISGNVICANLVPSLLGTGGAGGGIYCYDSGPTISDNTIFANSADREGGGIYCFNSSPTISGNTISADSAAYGGGIYCDDSDPTISNNSISANSAYFLSGGGGIYCCNNSTPIICDNTISENYGSGIHWSACSPTISNNTINANSGYYGGGIGGGNSNATVRNNTISANSAEYGGGISLDFSYFDTFELNEVSLNFASSSGGGIYLNHSSPTFDKCTIVHDIAATGGGLYCIDSSPVLVNCVLWGNDSLQIYQTSGGSNPTVTYSDVQDSWPGLGNINEDPLFWNAAQGDYHLQWGSPCINTGDPNPLYNDPDGSQADMGCYPYDPTYTPVKFITPCDLPAKFALLDCYPNPFNSTTGICYELRVASHVRLRVYNTAGRLVETLVDGWREAGEHRVTFDGSVLPSGVYLYRLDAGGQVATGKMVLLK